MDERPVLAAVSRPAANGMAAHAGFGRDDLSGGEGCSP
jgi:hypothetical protein